MATSGNKSLVRGVFWLWQNWLGDYSVSSSGHFTLGLSSTCMLQEMLMLPGSWSELTVASSSKHLWGFSLPWAFSPFAIVLVSGLQSPPGISHDLETCCHISHVFWIQMLWPKLSSELRLNHPSFSVNRRTQLPAQLLRYFELQLHVLARISLLLLFHHAEKKRKRNQKLENVYWFHVSYHIIKKYIFLSIFEDRRCYIVTYLQID